MVESVMPPHPTPLCNLLGLNDMRYLINKLQVRGRRPRQIKCDRDRETAELANIMECLHTCTCLALCVCVCECAVLCTSCLARVSSRIHYERQTSWLAWPGLAWRRRRRRRAINLHRLLTPLRLPLAPRGSIAAGRNRFRTFHASSPDQREHATREFAWAKQKPLALSQALFIVNEIAETTTTRTRTSREGPCA